MEELRYDENNQVVLPQPDEIPEKDKMDASGAYVMMFASTYLPLPLVNLIAAFIYHIACRKRSRFVAFHTYQSFVSQIPASVSLWGVLTWMIVEMVLHPTNPGAVLASVPLVASLIIMLTWNLVYTVISIVACVRARKGRMSYFPLLGKHAYDRYFGPDAIRATARPSPPAVNRPPVS